MRLKQPKASAMDRGGAEEVAAQAIAFLAAEPARLMRFMSETGLDPATLASALADGSNAAIEAALEHIMADESLLLVFATEVRRRPDQIAAAHALLSHTTSMGH